jgi:hypothetical protein
MPAQKIPRKRDQAEVILRGLVADILDERQVVLNIGSRSGVELGTRFAILDESDYEVKDPRTGETLGKLPPREKVRVEVVEFTETLSVARTYQTRQKNIGGTGASLSAITSILEPPRWIEEPVTFRIGEGATFYKKIAAEESIVQIGDAVKQVD